MTRARRVPSPSRTHRRSTARPPSYHQLFGGQAPSLTTEVNHVSAEAAAGGPIVRENATIEIDIPGRTIRVIVSDDEHAARAREEAAKSPQANRPAGRDPRSRSTPAPSAPPARAPCACWTSETRFLRRSLRVMSRELQPSAHGNNRRAPCPRRRSRAEPRTMASIGAALICRPFEPTDETA